MVENSHPFSWRQFTVVPYRNQKPLGSISGIQCFFDHWIRDPGENPDQGYNTQDPNIPDRISDSLVDHDNNFRVKNTEILCILLFADPGSGAFLTLDLGPRMENSGSGIITPDPQHC